MRTKTKQKAKQKVCTDLIRQLGSSRCYQKVTFSSLYYIFARIWQIPFFFFKSEFDEDEDEVETNSSSEDNDDDDDEDYEDK